MEILNSNGLRLLKMFSKLLLLIFFPINDVVAAYFTNIQRQNCRGENSAGRGVRLYLATLTNLPPKDSTESLEELEEICRQTPGQVMGIHFHRPTRCSVIQGEFDVPDTSCDVNRKWVLDQIRLVIGSAVTCDWSRWSSEGCSSPFTDSVSIAFKEQFHHACVFHDYCYASPWSWVNTDDGRHRCDNQFRTLMIASCQSYLPCMAAAEVYWMAVRAFGKRSYQKAQVQVVNGIIKCSKLVN